MTQTDASRSAPYAPSAAALAAFTAPQIALAALYFPVFIYLADFYSRERGVDLEVIGVIFVVARLIDAVTDPLVGWLSDRTPARWGRRKLWLALSTPFVCLSVWMAMAPPAEIDETYVAIWMTALTLSWTFALTPYFAWSAEICADYAGRARVAAWRESGFLIGTLGAAALYGAYAAGGTAEPGLEAVAIAVVVSLPIFALLALLFAPEPEDRSSAETPLSWREGLAVIWANRPFWRLMASHAINSAANALPAVLFLFFAAFVLDADRGAAALILAIYFVTAIVAAPFWSWAARRWSKHRAWSVAMIYSAAIFATVFLLGEGDVAAFAVISALTGFAYGADVVLPPALQADVVDVDTAACGRQRTGAYMAAWSVVMKGASAIAGGAGLIVLGYVGFDEAATTQSDDAIFALAALYAGVPILLKLIAVALVWRYPLDAQAQADLQREIEARQAR